MDSYATVDRSLRARLLAELRAARRRAWAHELTPAERLRRSLAIVAVAHATRTLRPPKTRGSDEPVEVLLALQMRLREAGARA